MSEKTRDIQIGSPLWIEACRLFRVVNGKGDGGSEHEFCCLNSGIRDGWFKLAKQTSKLSAKEISVGKLLAGIKAQNPPLKSLGAIIDEARQKHDDILTEPSWNEDYTLELHLRVREIRRIAEFVESLQTIYANE